MKLSRTSWLILTAGVLAITFGSLGATRSQQLSEGQKLSDELAVAKLRLSKLDLSDLYTQQQKLQAQIGENEAQVKADTAALSQPNDSIFVSDAVFRIAAASGVEVTEMSSAPLTRSDLGKVPCNVLQFDVTAKGNVPNLIDFITRLNIDFPTGQVDTEEITVPLAARSLPVTWTDNITGNETIGNGDASDNATPGDNPAASGNITRDDRPSAHVRLQVFSYRGN